MSAATTSERRELGTIRSYSDLLAAFRAQVANLNINYAMLDELAGYTSTYSTKVLAADPARHFSADLFNAYLEALCIDLVAYHNPKKHEKLREKFKHKLVERETLPAKHSAAVVVKFSRRYLHRIAKKGGHNSRKYMSEEQATALARKASLARWHASESVALNNTVAVP